MRGFNTLRRGSAPRPLRVLIYSGREVKRSEALKPLSRDHHRGLFVAMGLKRATRETAPEARQVFLEFWRREGSKHFRIEEELVLPAYARYRSAEEEDVVRVLTDHVDLRRRGADLEAEEAPAVEALHELGERLESHIRHEERVLFPLIEDVLPEEDLIELAAKVERAEKG
jgi:Hemerythrin HHE cation binding domain